MKKIISLALCLSMVASITAFANDLSDVALDSIENHWSEDYILYLNEKGVILPSSSSGFTPDTQIYRAEFMRYINRTFAFEDVATINFEDVADNSWYYSDVARAVYQGYIQGTGNNLMNPLGYLTREEAVVILSRLHNIQPDDNTDNLKFTDTNKISDWSLPFISYAVDKGYITGRNDNTFDPQGNITRAEIAKILYYFAGNIVDDNIYSQLQLNDDQNNTTITKPNSSLQNTSIDGDLYITQAVGDSVINLSNMSVDGTIIISGGHVKLSNVWADNIVIKSPQNDYIFLEADDNSYIDTAYIHSSASIIGDVLNINEDMYFDDASLYLQGEFENVELTTNIKTTISDSEIEYLTTSSKSSINMLRSTIENAEFNGATTVTGTGDILYADINVSNVELYVDVDDYNIADGVTAVVDSDTILGNGDVNPSAFAFDSEVYDVTSTLSFKEKDVVYVSHDKVLLEKGVDYSIKDNKITIHEEFLNNRVDCQLEIHLYSGETHSIFLSFTECNYLDAVNVTFDKNNANSGDIVVNLTSLPDSNFKKILYNGYYELSANEYSIFENEITIYSSYLRNLIQGDSVFTIDMSTSNDPKLTVTIK